ncbi:helix-turn-helix transcriptional regulator [Shewanella algidipiscicola]|uniref:Helix-turn-helix transcriptional regulator n=1 Tax=Shewanella algidipiscicola TaxID=614070 RepID=A0ABQ4PEF6_9GAMM|nr:LuxR C-terminal-related transcriptional regulator [Shewanella algidipiscicola]GIU45886.1 helix-turn-helix transcriptional regulator [Shewanella algidipiscicola]
MDKIDELVFLHQVSSPCELGIWAQSLGLRVRIVHQIDELEPDPQRNSFYFIAQQGAAVDKDGMPLIVPHLLPYVPLALYLVDRHAIDAEVALLQGVQGLLFSDDRQDLQLIGLHEMLRDELWYDRTLLSKVLRRFINPQQSSQSLDQETVSALQKLTDRERTIIKLVSSGARNKEIAAHLFISEHTVKAHISSIFRKTQSRNRVELLRWSQANAAYFECC